MLHANTVQRRLKIVVRTADDVVRFTRRSERSIAKETALLRDEYPRAKSITITEV